MQVRRRPRRPGGAQREGTTLFELLFIACVGTYCSLEPVPQTYPTHERCAMAAAMTAGRIKGKLQLAERLDYRYNCRPTGGDGQWYAVVDGEATAIDFTYVVRDEGGQN